jgi:hypothetical protein
MIAPSVGPILVGGSLASELGIVFAPSLPLGFVASHAATSDETMSDTSISGALGPVCESHCHSSPSQVSDDYSSPSTVSMRATTPDTYAYSSPSIPTLAVLPESTRSSSPSSQLDGLDGLDAIFDSYTADGLELTATGHGDAFVPCVDLGFPELLRTVPMATMVPQDFGVNVPVVGTWVAEGQMLPSISMTLADGTDAMLPNFAPLKSEVQVLVQTPTWGTTATRVADVCKECVIHIAVSRLGCTEFPLGKPSDIANLFAKAVCGTSSGLAGLSLLPTRQDDDHSRETCKNDIRSRLSTEEKTKYQQVRKNMHRTLARHLKI